MIDHPIWLPDMQASTESSPNPSTHQSRSWFGPAFFILLLAVNGYALFAAWEDRSFNALAIAIIFGPIANGTLALFGLIMIPFLKSRQLPYSYSSHMGLTQGLPVLFIIVDFFIIFSMDLRGC